jgi:hypothetical protein
MINDGPSANYKPIYDSSIFRLKLRNNTHNSLKNALRKFDLRVTGTKDDCLDRLSTFLSTAEGRTQAYKLLPPDIFNDLYETDLTPLGEKAYEEIKNKESQNMGHA